MGDTTNRPQRPEEVTMARTTRKSNVPTKVCTKSGKSFPATTEFFYKDKSQKDGLSPWSKDAERAYNAAYAAALKKAGVTRVKDMTEKQRKAFATAMRAERVTRGTHTNRTPKAS
jgi:hypothetical protein